MPLRYWKILEFVYLILSVIVVIVVVLLIEMLKMTSLFDVRSLTYSFYSLSVERLFSDTLKALNTSKIFKAKISLTLTCPEAQVSPKDFTIYLRKFLRIKNLVSLVHHLTNINITIFICRNEVMKL